MKKYTMDDTPVVVGFYEWGPWVNGGAWMHTEVGKVDLLYRNINQIENTIDEAQVGKWENHYEQQPPYGFTSMIYLAECIACIPLYDAKGIINRLKRLATKYPQALKESVINRLSGQQNLHWRILMASLQTKTCTICREALPVY
ncbi:hypothetical protein KUH03_38830 [Sphingobacterium sp. E70]|uniref:hypothetical protein n=1 Tax=Sphingobacterium sp. E70 TaxID=2853439 RepID=UPI00211B8052|nr:hypothetical protein [Sphingobacterium sp. E70]ULT24789.1 hypothetical protein KUH03_38830 [Sphingobacterium sp. E70]